MNAAAPLTPVAANERIETLDILRGFAIFAILIVNWTTDLLWDVDPLAGWAGFADRATHWLIWLLLDEKSWPIFAFLFGLGFAVQMQRMEARDISVTKFSADEERLDRIFATGTFSQIVAVRAGVWWERMSSWRSYVTWL